jgi:hypothetical protein
LALGKKIIIVKNATAYTWDWYCHLVVDRASFLSLFLSFLKMELANAFHLLFVLKVKLNASLKAENVFKR